MTNLWVEKYLQVFFLSFFLQLPELSSQKALRNIKGDAPEMNGNEKKELPSAECALHKNL